MDGLACPSRPLTTFTGKPLAITTVSLVRGSRATIGPPEQDPERHFSFANVVYWNVEGPVKVQAVVREWIG